MCVQCVLAAIVIVNLKGVFLQALDVRALYRREHYWDMVSYLDTLLTAAGQVADIPSCQ